MEEMQKNRPSKSPSARKRNARNSHGVAQWPEALGSNWVREARAGGRASHLGLLLLLLGGGGVRGARDVEQEPRRDWPASG